MPVDISQIVDLGRYPVNNPDSVEGKALLQKCQGDIEQKALCLLPDFVRPEVVSVMAVRLAASGGLWSPEAPIQEAWREAQPVFGVADKQKTKAL